MPYAIDPELIPALAMLPQNMSELPLAESRAVLDKMTADSARNIDVTGVQIRGELVPGPDGAPDITLRIFTPERRKALGVVFDIHGGGFTFGSAAMNDGKNIQMARELGAVVVSVEYRLAPEDPFPAGLEDCYAGLLWVAKNADVLGIDPEGIVLYGASAGGGLCAALTLLVRDRGGPTIVFQYLGVPELDDRLETPSMRAFTDVPMFARPAAEKSWDRYLGLGVRGTADVSPYAAPSRAADLSGLPPAYISVMEFDPLRDEGIVYAQALLAAGVTVELHLFPGTFHGSSFAGHAEVSRRENAERLAVLGKALAVEN